MIISRTPFRISLLGGGTDYPEWFHKNGGCVLGGAIQQYCTVMLRSLPPFHEHKTRVVTIREQKVTEHDEIEHPAVRAALELTKVTDGLEIFHSGDLPGRSGMGSSSSFAVGLLNALRAYQGKMSAPWELTQGAIHLERDILGDTVGCQDQTFAAYGGFNRIDFARDGGIHVSPVPFTPE